MLSLDSIFNAFITLFVTIDPIGNAPIFLGLTAGMSAAVRRSIALRGTGIAFCILTLFALTGTAVLDAIGITIDAFRIAGGLLLFVTAFDMIYGRRQERREEASNEAAADHLSDLAVFPLALPLLAGPGTISATILLSSQLSSGDSVSGWVGIGTLVGILAVMMILTAGILIAAHALDKVMGTTGKLVITRLLGVLLAALAVQYVADGVLAFIAH
ncbi:MAG: MarC family protein [Granulosicoccus sp.]|nr:MarC family protein [Granulosicoccus sp.]